MAVIEGVCVPAAFDFAALRHLLRAAQDCSPVGLHAPDRCCLQLRITADGLPDAMTLAVQWWDSGVRGLKHLAWKVTRVELMTVEEFEHDCEVAYRNSDVWPSAGAESEAGQPGMGEELLRLAFEDQLTRMETPGIFACRLEEAAARRRDAHSNALLVVDLDGCKALDDRSGTPPGNQLVAAVAERLLDVLGGSGKATRIGGDRFAVFLEPASEEVAVATAERLLDALRHPFRLEGDDVAVSASVGVAIDRDGDGSALIEHATVASAAAKLSNRGLHVFRPGAAAPGAASRLSESLLLLRRTAATAADATGLAAAAAAVLPDMCAYTGWPLAHLCLVDASGHLTATEVSYSSDPTRFRAIEQIITGSSVPVDAELYRRVLAGRRPEWTSDLSRGAVPADLASAVGLRAVVVVPVLAGNEIVGVLQWFVEDGAKPDATVLDTLAVVGFHLGQAALRTGISASPASLERPSGPRPRHRPLPVWAPATVPFRYELFGWEPAEPAPGLDAYVVRRSTEAPAAKDLWEALHLTYERLAAAVAGRSVGMPDDRRGGD